MRKYTLKEAEKAFGLPVRFITFLLRKGLIEPIIEGSKIFITEEEANKYKKLGNKEKKKLKNSYIKTLGPGIITGAADDDGSGIVTYTQVGAQYGLSLSWLAVYLTPMMAAVQETSARIGIVTGRGLSGVLKKHYSKSILIMLVSLLIITNTINIGADIGAMAAALELVTPLTFFWGAFLATSFMIIIELTVRYYRYVKYLKFLTFSLFAYILAGFIVKPDALEVLRSVAMPHIELSSGFLAAIVAVMGTTISPYLFFWQASEEVEENTGKNINTKHHPIVLKREIEEMRKDTWSGMIIANVVFIAIVVTAAYTLHKSGITSIESADQAAMVLRPLAGDFAYYLFTIGIIGVCLLAIPVLATSSAYALSELVGWKEGLSKKFIEAKGFYLIIIFSMIIGLLINLIGINPMKALYYTAILNGIISPIIMFFVFRIGGNKKILGENTNPKWVKIWGGLATILMGISAIFLIVSSLF